MAAVLPPAADGTIIMLRRTRGILCCRARIRRRASYLAFYASPIGLHGGPPSLIPTFSQSLTPYTPFFSRQSASCKRSYHLYFHVTGLVTGKRGGASIWRFGGEFKQQGFFSSYFSLIGEHFIHMHVIAGTWCLVLLSYSGSCFVVSVALHVFGGGLCVGGCWEAVWWLL